MVLSSIPNEWPQVMDEMGTNNLMSSSSSSSSPSSARPMDQTKLPATQDHHLPLKCPRCDSLNTKFCYYNNYSLSQPRHFCKACKRYWTRGGTLRNVPVGGGYRKNKRAKRPSVSSAMASSGGNCTVSTATTTPLITVAKPVLLAPDHDDPVLHHINVSDSNHLNSLLYGVPNSPSYTNIDHHGQYSLGLMNYPSSAATWIHDENIQMQDVVSSSSSILSNLSLLGYSSPLSRAKSNVSLLSSSGIVHQQQKLALGDMNGDGASNIQALLSLEGLHMGAGFHGEVGMMNVRKGVKSEEISENQIGKKLEWGLISSQNPLIEPHGSSIASVYLNNPMSVGANWPDLAN